MKNCKRFVPALLLAYVVGIVCGEIGTPVNVLSDGVIFNPFPAWPTC